MKYTFKLMAVLFTVALTLGSCAENEIPIFDTQNGRSIAGFSSGDSDTANIIFNPTEDTENVITISVSTVSDQDRSVVVTLDADDSTLNPAVYSLSTLNPVIAAGDFTTSITVTTSGDLDDLNSEGVLNFELTSVEGAEILADSESDLTLNVIVRCSMTDAAAIVGTYRIIRDDFGIALDDTFEIVEGPGENQYTLVDPLGHPDPDNGGAPFEVIMEVNPTTGVAAIARQPTWHCANLGCGFGQGRVNGNGLALTCINQIQFNALQYTVDAGSFGSFAFFVEKIN